MTKLRHISTKCYQKTEQLIALTKVRHFLGSLTTDFCGLTVILASSENIFDADGSRLNKKNRIYQHFVEHLV